MSKETTKAIAAGASALGGLVALFWMFWAFTPTTIAAADWTTLLKLAIAVLVAFGVTAMIRFALSPLVSVDPVQPSTAVDADVVLRSRMAPIVLGIGSAAIILLALGLIIEFGLLAQQQAGPADPSNVVKPKIDTLLTGVFASVLPVFATWVGTVIAFYFTNESFRQAAQAARESTAPFTDRIRSIPARTAMVPRARMVVLKLPTGKPLDSTVLKDIDDKFNGTDVGANGVRISRLVILDSTDIFVAIIHVSLWMELLNNGLRQTPPVNVATDTLGPLINQTVGSNAQANPAAPSTYRDIVRKQVAFVSADQTLADAKAAMDAVSGCQDIIVTQTGAPTMSVTGWIMNTDIGRLSQA